MSPSDVDGPLLRNVSGIARERDPAQPVDEVELETAIGHNVRQLRQQHGLTVEKVGTRFPGFTDAAISSSYAGCYDVTPDWNPVISTTGLDGLVVAAGFSGHGFKIAPAVGQLVADLVVDGHSTDSRIPHSDFRLSRFDEGDLLRSPYPYVGAGEMR